MGIEYTAGRWQDAVLIMDLRVRYPIGPIAGVGEVVGALGRREQVEQPADGGPQAVDGALGGLAQKRLELGEGLLDRIEVGGVGRQVAQLGAVGLDRLADAGDLVGGEIVHDDDVARPQLRGQHLLDPSAGRCTVHGAVGDVGGDEAARGQAADEGGALPVAVRDRAVQAPAARAAAVAPRHVGRGTGLVDEDQPRRAHLALPGTPVGALLGDVGPVLLLGPARLF